MRTHDRWWKLPLLETLFFKEDVQLILSIPVSASSSDDVCIWRGTKNGLFSVKSAYYIQRELEALEVAKSSSHRGVSTVWRQIWELKIPNVEKNFLWRACHESLPTKQNLYRRKIVEDHLCPICGIEEETACHTLWQCAAARDVWCVGPKQLQKSAASGSGFLKIVEYVFDKCSMEEIVQFAGIARRLWLRRNEVVHVGFFVHPNILVQQTTKAIEEFAAASEQQEAKHFRSAHPRQQRWSVPDGGWMKVNCDASVNKMKGWLGYGAVVRDERGMVHAAQCKTIRGNLDPTLAKAGAVLMAISLCHTMGFHSVIFESDAQLVVDGVYSMGEDWSRLGLMVEDIKAELTSFHQWCMDFIRREGNQAAHVLSKKATRAEINQIWISQVPDCIQDIILMEQHAPSS